MQWGPRRSGEGDLEAPLEPAWHTHDAVTLPSRTHETTHEAMNQETAAMETSPFNLVIDTGPRELTPAEEEHIRTRLGKVDRWTHKFPSRSCHVSMQTAERDGMHRVVISLKLPQVTLVGRAEEPQLLAAFDRAIKRLLRQLNEFKHLMRREHLHRKARQRREEVIVNAEAIIEGARDQDRERLIGALGPLLEDVKAAVEAELEEIEVRRGEAGVSLDDMMNTIVTRALEEAAGMPGGVARRTWLFRIAMDVVDELVPSSAPAEGSAVATGLAKAAVDTILEAEHDEASEAAAEEVAKMFRGERMRAVVERHLAALPRDWRRAFRLHYVQGLDHAEIAEILDLHEEQVTFRLRGAAEFMRDHLEELRSDG